MPTLRPMGHFVVQQDRLLEATQFGFRWGPALVERWSRDHHSAVLAVSASWNGDGCPARGLEIVVPVQGGRIRAAWWAGLARKPLRASKQPGSFKTLRPPRGPAARDALRYFQFGPAHVSLLACSPESARVLVFTQPRCDRALEISVSANGRIRPRWLILQNKP